MSSDKRAVLIFRSPFFHFCITSDEHHRNRDRHRCVALFAVCIRTHFLRYLSQSEEIANFQLLSLADFNDTRHFGFMPQVLDFFRLVRDAILSSSNPESRFFCSFDTTRSHTALAL